MRSVINAVMGLAALGAGAASPASVAPAAGAEVIVIEAAALRPPVLATTVGQRVTFINRSGRPAHVEFLGGHTEHHVFQVPGQIWAVFNRVGRHHFVVHFSVRRAADLRGAVDVADDPNGQAAVPVCTELSVMGECLEP